MPKHELGTLVRAMVDAKGFSMQEPSIDVAVQCRSCITPPCKPPPCRGCHPACSGGIEMNKNAALPLSPKDK